MSEGNEENSMQIPPYKKEFDKWLEEQSITFFRIGKNSEGQYKVFCTECTSRSETGIAYFFSEKGSEPTFHSKSLLRHCEKHHKASNTVASKKDTRNSRRSNNTSMKK